MALVAPLSRPCPSYSSAGHACMAPSPLLNVHRPPPTASNARRVSVRACAAQGRNGTAHQPSVLPSLKWDSKGLVTAIVQHVETGEVLMQAFADEAAVLETLETGLATFYSRSRKGRWCKGETSGHFIKVLSVHLDCDRDSLIYVGDPIGPACHTNAPTCYFTTLKREEDGKVREAGTHTSRAESPLPTLFALERIIADRRAQAAVEGAKPSWTAKLLSNPELLCSKIREEAGELCATWEEDEGRERTVSEAADLLYHAMVFLNHQGVSLEEVSATLRQRFAISGLVEKAARKK
ncbi:HIS4 [Auxenochlorella protothecoides x Auxenochlorella symbiontica]